MVLRAAHVDVRAPPNNRERMRRTVHSRHKHKQCGCFLDDFCIKSQTFVRYITENSIKFMHIYKKKVTGQLFFSPISLFFLQT